MSIHELRIHDLRCFTQLSLKFFSHLNVILAPNGSGKTTLLEALYILSCGHSFRTREITPLIRHSQSEFTIFARLFNGDSLSVHKSSVNLSRIKINQSLCKRTSELAYYLPCQIYYQDLFALMDGGPSLRRLMMDWGLFHVEHSYHQQLKQYYQILKQRNALLRQKKSKSCFEPWDRQLGKLGESIHELRQQYMVKLQSQMQIILQDLSAVQCTLSYDKGWDRRQQGGSLYEYLQAQYERDIAKGYTSSGVHQADIHFLTEALSAKKVLSRGQQKMVLIAVKLAQTELISSPCLHLLDDVFAELDHHHVDRLLQKISNMEGQFVMTMLPASKEYIDSLSGVNVIELQDTLPSKEHERTL